MCSLQHPADLALGMDWCGKSGALLCRQLNLEVHLQVMLTISCQLIVCFRCQSAGEYELAAIKKSSIGWGVGMVPRTQMKFLADPAWSRDQASWWPWYILNTRVPRGGSAGVNALGSTVKRVRNWKRKGPVFWRDPLGRCSCWGRGQSQECCWGAGAVETAWAATNSCGLCSPNTILPNCFVTKASFSFLVHNLLWQCAQLEWPNTHYQEFQTEENEPFLHSVTISVMDWQGVGAGPAPSARTNNISGAVELPWHCVFS